MTANLGKSSLGRSFIINQSKILGINFINTTFRQFETTLERRIDQRKNTFVVTANPEIVMYARKHPQYQEIIRTANYITPDGIGIVKASQILKHPVPERISGYDLFRALLTWGNQNRKSVYLLGARQVVINKLAKVVHHCYPQLIVTGMHNGYFNHPRLIANQIRSERPDMIFVALGFPKQEGFIHRYRTKDNALWMGVGGSFDVLSGFTKRAPQFWIRHHVEWLYRLLKNPWRFKRMLVLPKFLIAVRAQKARINR